MAPLDVAPWIHRVVGMETRLHVDVQPGPNLMIRGDADQLEQVLINLLRNATDAALETRGGVRVGWRKNATYVEIKWKTMVRAFPIPATCLCRFSLRNQAARGSAWC
jgi:signal transduction histidine kinase